MNSPHAVIQERHDGADVCPMCFTEILYVSNQCPHCGAPVDSPGLTNLKTPAEPVMAKSLRLRLIGLVVFGALYLSYVYLFFTTTESDKPLYHHPVRWFSLAAYTYFLSQAILDWRRRRNKAVMS